MRMLECEPAIRRRQRRQRRISTVLGTLDRLLERGCGFLQAGGDDGGFEGGLVGEVLVEGGGADPDAVGQAAHGEGPGAFLLQELAAGHHQLPPPGGCGD
jgi:hypothetical protein